MQKFLYKNNIISQYYNKVAFMIECLYAVKLKWAGQAVLITLCTYDRVSLYVLRALYLILKETRHTSEHNRRQLVWLYKSTLMGASYQYIRPTITYVGEAWEAAKSHTLID